MKAQEKYSFERGGFFTKNDKIALVNSLEEKSLKQFENRITLHGKTRLELSKKSNLYDNGVVKFEVKKSVSGGNNYLYSCYFREK